MNKKNTAILSSVSLAALALSGCGSETPAQVTPVTPVKTETPVAAPVVTETPVVVTSSAQTYKDGTYSTVGSYKSPAGPEEIGVTLTLKNDIITDITVTPKATARRSIELQTAFAANYKPMVLGKSIVGLNLGKVAGASLTPLGFNDALAKIEAEAA